MSAPVGKQPCFLCEGDGNIYPFENKRGIPQKCPTCNGAKFIEDYYARCPHCNGTNKIYDADDGRGIAKPCKLCDKKGYIDFVCLERN